MAHLKYDRVVIDRTAQYLALAALIGGVLYGLNRLAFLTLFSETPFFRTSFDDCLALIVFVPLSYLAARKLHVIPDDEPLRFWHIGLFWVIFSLFFEVAVPQFLLNRTRDTYDVLAYASGGLVLWMFNLMALDYSHLRQTVINVVYYDGTCGICEALTKWSNQNLRRSFPLDFKPYQLIDQGSDKALFDRAQKSVVVRLIDGTELMHGRAVGTILLRLKFPWNWCGWFLIAPFLWPVTTVSYRLFARFRHKISAWTGNTACKIE